MQATLAAGILAVFWYGGHLLIKNELTPGGFLAFTRALMRANEAGLSGRGTNSASPRLTSVT